MSEDITSKAAGLSDYIFLLTQFDKIQLIDCKEYFQIGEKMLMDIRKGEDYLFFHMKDSIKNELNYYSNNLKELDEIIEILDGEYAVSSYHTIIKSLLDTKHFIKEKHDLEYILIEDVEIKDEKEDGIKGIYSLPLGTIDELISIKNKSKKGNNERMYI